MDVSLLVALLDSPLILLTLLIPIFSLLLYTKNKKPPPSSSDGRGLPPSPPGLPILGHLPLLGSLPHRKLRSLAEAHGPVMLLRLGRVPTVVASSAAAAEEAMKTRDLAFASRPRVRMAERLLYGRDLAFAPYGGYWRQARRVSVVHLLSPRRVISFRGVREQEVATLLDRVRRAGSLPAVVNLSDLLMSYANSIISRAAFGDGDYGLNGDDGGEKLRKVFAEFEELLGTVMVGEFVPWLAWVDTLMGLDARAARTSEELDGLLERVIADHRQRRCSGRPAEDGEDDHRDFVDVLLDVSEAEDEEAGEVRFDMVSIKAIILAHYAASDPAGVLGVHRRMQDDGVEPDLVTYTSLMNGMCVKGDALGVLALLEEMEAKGCEPNERTYNTLLMGLCKNKKLDKAVEVYKSIVGAGMKPETPAYAHESMVRALCRAGRVPDA